MVVVITPHENIFINRSIICKFSNEIITSEISFLRHSHFSHGCTQSVFNYSMNARASCKIHLNKISARISIKTTMISNESYPYSIIFYLPINSRTNEYNVQVTFHIASQITFSHCACLPVIRKRNKYAWYEMVDAYFLHFLSLVAICLTKRNRQ